MADDYVALCSFMQRKLKPLIDEMTLMTADDAKVLSRSRSFMFGQLLLWLTFTVPLLLDSLLSWFSC